MEADRDTLFSVEELRDHINRNATRVNRLANMKGTSGVDRTTTATTLRSYIARGILTPDFYREDVQEIPVFGPDAVEYFTGEPETSVYDYTCNELAKKTGVSDHTVRRHYKAGHIKPTAVERRVVRVPLFIRSKVLDLWYSPKFERTLPSSRLALEDKRKAKRTAVRPKDHRTGRYQPLKTPGALAPLGRDKPTRSFKNDDLELPHEKTPIKFIMGVDPARPGGDKSVLTVRRGNEITYCGDPEGWDDATNSPKAGVLLTPFPGPPASILVSPDITEAARAFEQAHVQRVQEAGPDPLGPSPPPTEGPTAATVDELLQRQEARMGKTEYRFLIRGVVQLRTDGADIPEQIAFINEYIKGLDDEADEYEGEPIDD